MKQLRQIVGDKLLVSTVVRLQQKVLLFYCANSLYTVHLGFEVLHPHSM